MTDPTGSAGRGRLAEVLATRGGRAEPEAPFVIEHREALIYMLCQAAELEHGIMCQYLFAAFSLKQRADEGLTPEELEAVTRWRRTIAHVATEEMLHLALVQNVLSAIGAAPHLTRPNLPAPAHHYPAGVNLTLVPFGEPALQHFMFLERPEGMALEGREGHRRARARGGAPDGRRRHRAPAAGLRNRSATCIARSSKVWRTSLRSSASATCSSGRRAHRRRAPTSAGPSSWP